MEWLAAVVLSNTKEEINIVQATKTQQLNWWDYGVELCIITTEEYLKKLTEEKELP